LRVDASTGFAPGAGGLAMTVRRPRRSRFCESVRINRMPLLLSPLFAVDFEGFRKIFFER
jgi:hypothetical protein